MLDIDVKMFNHAVFEYLKTTDYPVGHLDSFPLIDNDEVLVKEDIFRLLRDSGVGVPSYYEEIPFEVDGKPGTYWFLRFLGARGKPSQRERLRCLLSLLAVVGKWVNDGRGKIR